MQSLSSVKPHDILSRHLKNQLKFFDGISNQAIKKAHTNTQKRSVFIKFAFKLMINTVTTFLCRSQNIRNFLKNFISFVFFRRSLLLSFYIGMCMQTHRLQKYSWCKRKKDNKSYKNSREKKNKYMILVLFEIGRVRKFDYHRLRMCRWQTGRLKRFMHSYFHGNRNMLPFIFIFVFFSLDLFFLSMTLSLSLRQRNMDICKINDYLRFTISVNTKQKKILLASSQSHYYLFIGWIIANTI